MDSSQGSLLNDWNDKLQHVSQSNVCSLVQEASVKEGSHGQEKLHALLVHIHTNQLLEEVGKALSLEQIKEILHFFTNSPQLLDKLPPLFVGISHDSFYTILPSLNKEELELLKFEALSEGLDHHLHLISKRLTFELESFESELYLLKNEIVSATNEILVQDQHKVFRKLIDVTLKKGQHLIDITNNALIIAWNTFRADLIETLSANKEKAQRLMQSISSDKSNKNLFALLENSLNSVFSDAIADGLIDALADDTPAIEALGKLNIWYHQDYIDIGLLDESSVESGRENGSLADQQKKNEVIYSQVVASLKAVGLHTLKDLKEAKIYSKQNLKQYLQTQLT